MWDDELNDFSYQCLNGTIVQPRFILSVFIVDSLLCQYCTMIPFIALLEYFLNKDFLLISAVLNGIDCMF